ncbi:unnamed protein product [Vicia faba]|uniref:Uncharacterized protein n=1 Tax=Vicia faba TaxID=3906 RepID=A0AAV1A891_VICFA|nr:unnamed protein product [Vicia faba]
MNCMRFKQGVIIKGKVDGQDEGPPNIEQPTLNNQHCVLDIDVHLSQLNLLNEMCAANIVPHNIPYFDKTGLNIGEVVMDVLILDEPIGYHHLSQKDLVIDNSHDRAVEDEETLCEDMLRTTKDEGLYDDDILGTITH